MVMPGDNVSMTVELIAPIAMDEGLRFAIREGGRTVGAGVVAGIDRAALAAYRQEDRVSSSKFVPIKRLARYHRPDAADRGRADEARPGRRRRCGNQAVEA